jgi:hypothetical protein
MGIAATDKESRCKFMMQQRSVNKTAVSHLDKCLIPTDFHIFQTGDYHLLKETRRHCIISWPLLYMCHDQRDSIMLPVKG